MQIGLETSLALLQLEFTTMRDVKPRAIQVLLTSLLLYLPM